MFILNLENDEVKWLDDISDESEGDDEILENLITEAENFYQREQTTIIFDAPSLEYIQ